MALTPTVVDQWHDGKRVHAIGTIAATGNYASGGVAVSFAGLVPTQNAPVFMSIQGKGGFLYEWDKANAKIKVRTSAGFTPAGTVTAPTFTGDALAAHDHDMKVIGGQGAADTSTVTAPAATDILGKQEAGDADILGVDVATKGGVVGASAGTPAGTNSVPTFTGAAVAAAAFAELAAAAFPAGVTGDVIQFYAIFALV